MSIEKAALLATIRNEWGCVDTWSMHAPSFDGMPEGAKFDTLVNDLLRLESGEGSDRVFDTAMALAGAKRCPHCQKWIGSSGVGPH